MFEPTFDVKSDPVLLPEVRYEDYSLSRDSL
jgi:hypothetical protein